MPIVIKSPADIERMRAAGRIVAEVHAEMAKVIEPGIPTAELDDRAREIIKAAGATPSFLGYGGFPKSICASVNEEIVHGIPGDRVLEAGQILSVDVGAYLDGFHGDAAVTYPIGNVAEKLKGLIEDTEKSFWVGFEYARAGNRIGDISSAIQDYAESRGLGVIRLYGGHGIGRRMHEDPSVLNYGEPGTGAKLQPGMTLAIEPMLVLGSPETRELDDDWTVVTVDGSAAAHFEHTVLITDDVPEVLTKLG